MREGNDKLSWMGGMIKRENGEQWRVRSPLVIDCTLSLNCMVLEYRAKRKGSFSSLLSTAHS